MALNDLASSSERIHDGQVDNAPTGLEIFRQQSIAPGFERGGDNQGVVEAEAVSAGEGESLRVDRHVDRANGTERNAHIGDGFNDNVPLEAELPTKDGCELVRTCTLITPPARIACRATSLFGSAP